MSLERLRNGWGMALIAAFSKHKPSTTQPLNEDKRLE